MYNLGEQFKIDYNRVKANGRNVIEGDYYRFTVLSPRLIRLEYNPNGMFLDNPTELALYRDFPACEFDLNLLKEQKLIQL